MHLSCRAMERSDSFGMDSRHYWDENGPPVKYESYNSNDGFGRQSDPTLNFATGALPVEDDGDYLGSSYLKKGKVSRQQDPLSHRIIEKRRRDRMNNCLADLSHLIPPEYLKKGRGRVEKTEIIEMAIRRLKCLQEQAHGDCESRGSSGRSSEGPISLENYRLGYQECCAEVMRYLVETQGCLPTDSLCVHLVGHLHRHCDSILKGNQLNRPRSNPETSSSSGSTGTYSAEKAALADTPPATEADGDYGRRYEDAAPYPSSPDAADSEYLPAPPAAERPLALAREPPSALRGVRRADRDEGPDRTYKFKSNIKQRFSQDCDESACKRSRQLDSQASSREGGARADDEPPATAEPRGAPPHLAPEPPPAGPRVPVFALNAAGKYYVPLNVDYESLTGILGPYELLRSASASAPLHPVCINVNFQPYLERARAQADEDADRQWSTA